MHWKMVASKSPATGPPTRRQIPLTTTTAMRGAFGEEKGRRLRRFCRPLTNAHTKKKKEKDDDDDDDDIKIEFGRKKTVGETTTTTTTTPKRTETHFDRLVRQNRWMFPQPQKDANEESLRKFWASRGVKDREMVRRLVALGAEMAEMRLEDEMVKPEEANATAALAARLDRMKVLFPTCDVNAMLWKKPEVLERSFKEITKAAIEWKAVLKDVKHVDVVVENNPQILLMTAEEIGDVGEGLEILRREFFGAEENNEDGEDFNDDDDVAFESKTTTTTTTTTGKSSLNETSHSPTSVRFRGDGADDRDQRRQQKPPTTSTGFLITPEFTLANVIEGEPYILTSNVKRRTEILLERKRDLIEKAESKGSGLGLFYARKSTSTALFGKLFLMDTEFCNDDDDDDDDDR